MTHNAWLGHYVYREDDMTKEEFDLLSDGDVIEHTKTKSRHVVVSPKNAGEPLTQIKKDDIKTRIEQFDIVIKVQSNDRIK